MKRWLTFGDSITLDGVFLPEITFSLVELVVSIVFCRLGAWEPDCDELAGPPKQKVKKTESVYSHKISFKHTG